MAGAEVPSLSLTGDESDESSVDEDENMSSENDYNSCEGEEDTEMANAEPNPHSEEVEVSNRFKELGEAVILAFPNTVEYEDDETKDIFDDGLDDDDDSSSDSDVSTIYEELSEPDAMVQVVKIPASSLLQDDDEDEHDDDDEERLASNVPDDIYETEQDWTEGETEESTSNAGIVQPETSTAPLNRVLLFADIENHRYNELSREKLIENVNTWKWSVLELEEMKKRIEQQLIAAEAKVEEAIVDMNEKEEEFSSILTKSGISQELYKAYEAFCTSLDPEFGQRGGFSITCSSNHGNCYTKYDPEFALFKEHIETPYDHYNFRCGASVFKHNARSHTSGGIIICDEPTATCKKLHDPGEYVVEFWPIKCPEPVTGIESTWGEQYPELYSLANAAVRAGSEAAMDMLVCLPDMNATFNGGWMFDYTYEDSLKDSPIIGKRWRFRSVHKIDRPCSTKEKCQRLELALRPENVRPTEGTL
ncbi:uncharacterized protein LY89DRAFT_777755 [Mollisia scopiformis]|uniref:Uncharacterized protein n=1 Tax=Mollisia scopiformis TaxID=149040 RepID=A0A194XSJ5_MOLSC|nr:uncharacterized protein LY89DRAFT_777755 [Mollisia scopiformis]KUJ22702.1 hypothetical protein LY89DRAFT_777755 [Mollisia scopiformis]